jgi:hypothetical protein
MKSFSRFFSLFLASALLFSACGGQEPDDPVIVKPSKPTEPETPVTPTATPVKFSLVAGGINSITLSKIEANSYLLKCTGADPYVFSSKLSSNLKDDYNVLEFEYKCDKNIGELQVFYALKGAPSEGSSQKYNDLAACSSYKKYVTFISKFRVNGWGKAGDCLRLDPGNDGGVDFYIRNIVIRPMNDEEKKANEAIMSKEEAKLQMSANLDKYLSATYPSSVTKVSVTADKVTVTGTCGGDGKYMLADVTPWQDVTELSVFPYVEEITGKNFTITLDRTVKGREGIDYDRVFSKWAVVKVDGEKHILDSHARYADDVEAKTSPKALPLINKKGFGAGDHSLYFQDIKTMNAGSITMNVLLSGIVTGKGSGYSYGGIDYSIGNIKDYVDMILGNVKARGTVVSAIILCPSNSLFKDPENTGGYYSMPNLTTAEAFNAYAAALEYMASRYNSEAHGRISHWIMHNEVDMGKDWTNMGDQPMLRYLDRYVKSMRICYNIVRQYDQNASILGSYTHNWTQDDGGYAPKDMLEKTVAYSNAEGDFWWGLAYHPYPQDLTKPEFWKNDSQSTYSMNTRYITFKNLEVIDKWIKLKENLYKGEKKRMLFLSEQGTNSPSYSESDLAKQAAGGAWAWKKVSKLDGIDAVQWHNWADNKAEFGLRIGLRAFEEGAYGSLQEKPVWYVWSAGGTDKEDEVFKPYLDVIGVTGWDSIMHDM